MQEILCELKMINGKLDNMQQKQVENPILNISDKLASIETIVSKIESNQWNLQ